MAFVQEGKYPYITTQKDRCDECGGSLKIVSHKHEGKVFCTVTCEANYIAREVEQLEFNLEQEEDDICLCKRCKPPPED